MNRKLETEREKVMPFYKSTVEEPEPDFVEEVKVPAIHQAELLRGWRAGKPGWLVGWLVGWLWTEGQCSHIVWLTRDEWVAAVCVCGAVVPRVGRYEGGTPCGAVELPGSLLQAHEQGTHPLASTHSLAHSRVNSVSSEREGDQ